MKTKKRWFAKGVFLTLALVGVILGSCTSPQKQYLPVTKDNDPAVQRNNPKRGTNYVFSVIEFDDQGEMWQREQLYRTMEMVGEYKSNGFPVTMVIFTHGWKNDASPASDNNLAEFQEFVTNIAQVYQTNDWKSVIGEEPKPRQFVGVYIAWRGNVYRDYPQWSVAVPLDLTFWNRKRIAGQVAGVSCTEAILSLAAQTRLGDAPETAENETNRARSQVILVGHSFGGLIVERAVTQAMLGTMLANVKEHGGDRKNGKSAWKPRPPFDMVLLVNPASESIVAKKMIEAMDNPLISEYAGSTNEEGRPWIISVSSKADWVTRLAFPFGRWLGSWEDKLRVYNPVPGKQPAFVDKQPNTFPAGNPKENAASNSPNYDSPTNYQRTYYERTAPQNDSLVNHVITLEETVTNSAYAKVEGEHLFRWLLRINLGTSSNYFDPNNQFLLSAGAGSCSVYTVKHIVDTNVLQSSGYWIVQAPPEILPDHDTIFTSNFYAMSAGLFRMTQVHHEHAVKEHPVVEKTADSGTK